MDGDPAVEPELDSFSRTLPLPYRVALIVVLGTYLISFSSLPISNCLTQVFGHGAQIFIICLKFKLFVPFPTPITYSNMCTGRPNTNPLSFSPPPLRSSSPPLHLSTRLSPHSPSRPLPPALLDPLPSEPNTSNLLRLPPTHLPLLPPPDLLFTPPPFLICWTKAIPTYAATDLHRWTSIT